MPTKDFLSDAKPVPQDADFLNGATQVPAGVIQDEEGRFGPEPEPSNLSLYERALFDPVGSGAHPQGALGGAEQVGGKAMETILSPFMHPIDTATGLVHAFAHPKETVIAPAHAFEEDWKKSPALALENAAGELLGTIEGGRMAGAGGKRVIESIPSKSHAVSVLNDIERAAHDLPVEMTQTTPALEKFGESVETGGKNALVLSKLARNINPKSPRLNMLARMESELSGEPMEPPSPEPITFPKARGFYENVSRVTRRPGILRRAVESPREPAFRFDAGPVRQALHSDLINAAQSLGRGEDYANAIKEYAQNAKLRGFLKKSGIALLPTAAGAVGAKKAYDLAHAIGW